MEKIKLSRNEKCLCGSGKKYKACCEKNGIAFLQIHEKEFDHVDILDRAIPNDKKSDSYFEYIKSIQLLERECILYKKEVIKKCFLDKKYYILFKTQGEAAYIIDLSEQPFHNEYINNKDIVLELKKLRLK